MKKIEEPNELGPYLASFKISGAEICSKTGLSKSDLSKLSSGITSRLTADKFYLINKAIKADLKNMLKEVFPKAKLVLDWKKDIANKKQEKTSTPLGFLLLKEENSRAIISAKTGITIDRLRNLSNKSNSELLAIELYLIEMALSKVPGTIFEEIFGDKEVM